MVDKEKLWNKNQKNLFEKDEVRGGNSFFNKNIKEKKWKKRKEKLFNRLLFSKYLLCVNIYVQFFIDIW